MFDELISDYEIHAHQPYNLTLFGTDDEISLAIQHQDLNLLPLRSCLHVTGKLQENYKKDNSNKR